MFVLSSCSADHAKTQTTEGRLTTSLPEDLFALAGVQLRTIRDRLTKNSMVLVTACSNIFNKMKEKQIDCRDGFLMDLETSCAAANDFMRMAEQAEDIYNEILSTTMLSEDGQTYLEDSANRLMIQYTNDAVFAAQHVTKFIFEPLEEELADKLFSDEWEEMTYNEMALTIVRTIEDYMADIEEWMDELMVRKLVDGLVKASINFYAKHLLLKAEKKGNKDSVFTDNKRAISRIQSDIGVIRKYFEGMIETFPALGRVINEEFSFLKTLFGLLYIAHDDGDEPELFFVELQKYVRNVDVVRFLVGDVYHLVNPKGEGPIYEVFEKHVDEMRALESGDRHVDEHYTEKMLRIDLVLIDLLKESKRKRPIKSDTMKNMEKAFGNWGWRAGSTDDVDTANDDKGADDNKSED